VAVPAALLAGSILAAPALGQTPRAGLPAVLHIGQIDRQDVRTQAGCEPDTLVEPDVAVSPFNPNIQVAVAHDCRFADAGAVDISYAWTHDGGAHWHHAPLPKLTKAVGGAWDRASDPVVAFGPDGTVYISALAISLGCPSGVTVSRSTNGGRTFSRPVLVHKSTKCTSLDDKDWLVVDTQPTSPFYGRVYVFWTAFLSGSSGQITGVPQVVRWSGDHGRHWSATHRVTPKTASTQNSQPMIRPDGTLTDVYMSFGGGVGGGPNAIVREHGPGPATQPSGVTLVARTSRDGGATWSAAARVVANVGGGPADIRCCLPSSTADPVTGRLYTVWLGNGPGSRDPVRLSTSTDGRHWSAPVQVTPDRSATIQHVNVDVTAHGGKVFVSYGTRNTAVASGNLVQQQVSSSTNGGKTFAPAMSLGPASNLRFAAVAGAKFPGDYIGSSATAKRLTLVWCVSSRPANPVRVYHQVLFAAVLRP